MDLNHARLPIPPLRRVTTAEQPMGLRLGRTTIILLQAPERVSNTSAPENAGNSGRIGTTRLAAGRKKHREQQLFGRKLLSKHKAGEVRLPANRLPASQLEAARGIYEVHRTSGKDGTRSGHATAQPGSRFEQLH